MSLPRIVFAAVLLFLPAVLEAGPEPFDRHKWWQSESYKSELGLTAQQSAQIEKIFQAEIPRLRAAKQELDREESVLSTLMADPNATESQVSLQVDRVESARSAMSKARTLMLFHMHRVLSPDQRTRLNALRERRSREKTKSDNR